MGIINNMNKILNYEIIKPEKYDSDIFIIFIHGFMFSDIWRRTNFIDKFNNYQCVLIDVLGFGKSPKPKDIEYGVDDHIEYMESTITHIIKDSKSPIIYGIGYSTGCIILVNLIAKNTLPWCKCAIISPAFFVKTTTINKELNTFFKLSTFGGFDDFFNMGKFLLNMFGNNITFFNNRYVKELQKNDPYSTKKTFFNLLYCPDWNIDEVFDKINKKILCIHPIHDEFIALDVIQKLCYKYKHLLTLIEWENNHFITHNNYKFLNDNIFNFFF